MTITMFEMWLFFTFLPNLGITSSTLTGVSVFIILILTVIGFVLKGHNEDALGDKTFKYLKYVIISAFICVITSTVTPSKKEMAAIILIPALTQNKELQTLGSETTKYLTEQLKEWTKELTTKDKGE